MGMAQRAAEAALEVLKSRKGFPWWWDEQEVEIQDEIREEMIDEIDKVIDG